MPPPEPYPPSERSKDIARAERMGTKVATVVTTSFDVIENPETPLPLRRKYCDKLRVMGIPAEQLPDWCNTMDALEGGRRRRRTVRRKTTKRRRTMRRRSKK